MGRWSTQFENHSFRSTWNQIRESVENVFVDDQSVVTSVEEIARLKKVTIYLDGLIKNIDPELAPFNMWDPFQTQGEACLQNINNYNSNRNIQHIVNANNHADNLLTYVRPYMIAPAKISKVLQNSLRTYATTIDNFLESHKKRSDEYLAEITNNNAQSNDLLKLIEQSNISIEEYHSRLCGADEESIKSRVGILINSIEIKNTEISSYYSELILGSTSSDSTKEKISEAASQSKKTKTKLKNY